MASCGWTLNSRDKLAQATAILVTEKVGEWWIILKRFQFSQPCRFDSDSEHSTIGSNER